MWQFILILYGTVGIILLILTAIKPRFFWPALTVCAVGASGLMIKRYTFIEEYLIGCIILGGLLSILIGHVHLQKNKEDIWDKLHYLIFSLFIVYMIIQCIRGLFFWGDIRKIRWIVYFGILGILSFIISKRGFPILSPKRLLLIVLGAGLGYLVLYLSAGLFAELFRGISRFELQTVEWPSTAYAFFPLVIVIPASLFLIGDVNCRYRRFGIATLITAIFATFYYFSRISFLTIFSFVIVSLFKSKIRRVVIFILIPLFLFSGLIYGLIIKAGFITKGTNDLFKELSRTTQDIQDILLWRLSSQDIDRKLHFYVGFLSIEKDWQKFFFGYGFRVHGTVISQDLKKLYKEKGFPELAERVKDDESTEGFTALLVDTGLIGLLLLGANFVFIARKIFIQKNNPNRIALLLSLFLTFLWLPVINIVDDMLFYLLIMPSGLLVQLSRYEAKYS